MLAQYILTSSWASSELQHTEWTPLEDNENDIYSVLHRGRLLPVGENIVVPPPNIRPSVAAGADRKSCVQLIPGATKSGKQKTPEWLKAVLQKLGQMPPDEAPKTAN